jgi:DNA polymerase-1
MIVERPDERSARRQNGRMNMNDSLTDTPTKPKILLLVDGSSYLYRAFHAMPDLRAVPGDPSSAPTGAIRGMINMLQSLRKEVPADYAACIFDDKGPTFRDALYPEYKGHRSPMPDDLRTQIEPIHEVVRLMGWKVLAVPGVEADDVIGTLAVTAARQGIEVIVSSGDKDLAQLVNSHITIIDTMNGRRRDVAGVEAEFGVPPHLMVDFQTLVGDAIDNVPGVPKVGPKTAAKWLQEYGSLDAVVANADQIKGVVGENLKKSLDWLPLGRQLLTIKTDCDLDGWMPDLPALDSIATGTMDTGALAIFYEKYGFKGLARALGGGPAAAPNNGRPGFGVGSKERSDAGSDPNSVRQLTREPGLFDEPEALGEPTSSSVTNLHYDTILTWDAFDHWLAKVQAADLVALDTETTSLDEMRAQIVGISFSVTPGEAAYTPTPTPRRSCRWPMCWPNSNPGWKTRRSPSWASMSNTTATCLPTTASRCKAMRMTPCCKATCLKCTSRTAWPAWPSGTWDAAASALRIYAARGPIKSALTRWILPKQLNTLVKTRT